MSENALDQIAKPAKEVLLSPASYWEIAIKVSLEKYSLSVPFETFFREEIEGSGVTILPIEVRHAAVLSSLPMHHKDRFDRMIISQAMVEQIPVVSADSPLDA